MATEYEIVSFKKGDFQDQHGNYWCDVVLKGEGEPIRIVVKDPMQYEAGQKVYGNITDETSKAGKAYRRFRREQRPEGPTSAPKQTDAYQDGMAWGNALNVAVLALQNDIKVDDLLEYAKKVYEGRGTTADVEQSGYEKAKAVAASLKDEVPVEVYDDPKYAPDPDEADVVTGGAVDLSDIPY